MKNFAIGCLAFVGFCFVAGLIFFFFIGREVYKSVDKKLDEVKEDIKKNPPINSLTLKSSEMQENKGKWRYNIHNDEMRNEKIQIASLESENAGFNGITHDNAELKLQIEESGQALTVLKINGVFDFDILSDFKTIKIKIDNQPITDFRVRDVKATKFDTVFIDITPQQIQNSKKIIIETPVVLVGNVQYIFNTEGLSINKK